MKSKIQSFLVVTEYYSLFQLYVSQHSIRCAYELIHPVIEYSCTSFYERVTKISVKIFFLPFRGQNIRTLIPQAPLMIQTRNLGYPLAHRPLSRPQFVEKKKVGRFILEQTTGPSIIWSIGTSVTSMLICQQPFAEMLMTHFISHRFSRGVSTGIKFY